MQNFEAKTLFIIKLNTMARVKINEAELNKLISRSINKALNEGLAGAMKQGGRSIGNNIKNFQGFNGGMNNGGQQNNAQQQPMGQAQQMGMQQPMGQPQQQPMQSPYGGQWNSTIAEGAEDEGLFNRLRSAAQGAKQGYQAQKTLDRGVDDFKQEHDWGDTFQVMDNPLSKMPNTAEEQAAEIYKQYKQYYMKANELLALYNKICRKYGLEKQAVGKFTNPKKASPSGSGLDFNAGGRRGLGAFGRQYMADRNPQHGTFWEEEE